MHSKPQQHSKMFGATWSPANAALTVLVTLLFFIFLLLFMTLTAPPARGQTYRVIYDFNETYGSGLQPFAGVTIDSHGSLYGTTTGGGGYGYSGTVFMLSPSATTWVYSPLHTFRGGIDGNSPYARVVFGPDGDLYGTTAGGGGAAYCSSFGGCGTVLKLHWNGASWQETILYVFQGPPDGMWPYSGDLVFDRAGNIYGTTEQGGYTGGNCYARDGCGIVYKLTPSAGGYGESVLYRFTEQGDGGFPNGGVILDAAGNLYGTAVDVYELSPSRGGWTETTLHTFNGGRQGGWAFGGVTFDSEGNLFGTTYTGGSGNAGTVFELSPLNGNWSYDLIHTFTAYDSGGLEYRGPLDSLTIDSSGNLYGTTSGGGLYGRGAVFKLIRSANGWLYTTLHDFCGGGSPCSDGAYPAGAVSIGPNGRLYGTTQYGGGNQGGVVWEISP